MPARSIGRPTHSLYAITASGAQFTIMSLLECQTEISTLPAAELYLFFVTNIRDFQWPCTKMLLCFGLSFVLHRTFHFDFYENCTSYNLYRLLFTITLDSGGTKVKGLHSLPSVFFSIPIFSLLWYLIVLGCSTYRKA